MNRIMFALSCLLPLAIAGLIYTQNRQAVAALPDVVNPNIYKDTPAPVMGENSGLPESSLMSREKILSSRILPVSARNLSIGLTNWGNYAKTEANVELPAVSPGRQVWILRDEYFEYNHYRLGKMRNTQVTSAFDAETGQILNVKIVGTPLEKVGPPSK
jgi:hypothetical protein